MKKQLTVKELVRLLKECPPNSKVCLAAAFDDRAVEVLSGEETTWIAAG